MMSFVAEKSSQVARGQAQDEDAFAGPLQGDAAV